MANADATCLYKRPHPPLCTHAPVHMSTRADARPCTPKTRVSTCVMLAGAHPHTISERFYACLHTPAHMPAHMPKHAYTLVYTAVYLYIHGLSLLATWS